MEGLVTVVDLVDLVDCLLGEVLHAEFEELQQVSELLQSMVLGEVIGDELDDIHRCPSDLALGRVEPLVEDLEGVWIVVFSELVLEESLKNRENIMVADDLVMQEPGVPFQCKHHLCRYENSLDCLIFIMGILTLGQPVLETAPWCHCYRATSQISK